MKTTPDQKTASFDVTLPVGKTTLDAKFLDAGGNLLCNAFYVKVKKLQ